MIPGELEFEDYEIIKKIGEGSFGFVYKVRHRTTHELYAMKCDQKSNTKTELQNQVAALNKIHQIFDFSCKNSQKTKLPINICLGSYFSQSASNKMLMPLHGENLMNLFQKCNGRFDTHTIYEVSKAMLRSIEFIHNLGFIHRDIKPQNFVAGRGYEDNQKENIDDGIYLVDFGLAKQYMAIDAEKSQKQHVKYEVGRKIRGTLMYMSVNVILGIEPSRRDDLESLMYILVLFLKGRLPWHNINVTRKNFEDLVIAKMSLNPDDLFANMPNQLKQAFIYIRKLKYEETPNYKRIMESLECLLTFKNAKIDEDYSGKYRNYCWEVMYEKENLDGLTQNLRQYMEKNIFIDGMNKEKEYTVMNE